jgi:hypothetical protein
MIFGSRGRTAQQVAEGLAVRRARQNALANTGREWILIQTEGAMD